MRRILGGGFVKTREHVSLFSKTVAHFWSGDVTFPNLPNIDAPSLEKEKNSTVRFRTHVVLPCQLSCNLHIASETFMKYYVEYRAKYNEKYYVEYCIRYCFK